MGNHDTNTDRFLRDSRFQKADLVICDGKILKSRYGDGFFTMEPMEPAEDVAKIVREFITHHSVSDVTEAVALTALEKLRKLAS